MANKKLTTSVVASLLLATSLYSTDLSEITVYSATKSNQSIQDVTSSIDVITKEEIEERHFTTIIEALNSIPGISFISNGGIGSTVTLNLRGTSNNRTLILIDGVKFKDNSSISGTDISTLMVTDIERIEVIKGSQSGIWGADAAAGVINIITRKAEEGFNGSIFSELGSFKTRKLGTSLSYANENFDVKLDAQKIKSDSFTSKAPRGEDIDQYEDDALENTTISLKGNYYINDNSKINFSIIDIDSLKEYDSSGPNDTLMKNDSQSRMYSLTYNYKYNKHDINIKLDKSRIKRDQIGTTWGVKLTDNETKSVELTDSITYNKKDFLLLGLGALKDEIDYTKADNTISDASNKTKYLFATNSNKFDNLILTESLRYDTFDNFDSKLTGKIGAKYKFNKKFSIFTNIGTSYSVPLLVKNINPWGQTNFDIEPEKSKSFDLGFNYDNFKLTYFYQKVTDLIDWYDPTPSNYYNNDAIYTNLDGESTFKGVEVSYKKELFSDLLVNLSYARLNAKDNDGNDLSRRAKDNLKFALDYYGLKDFHFNVNGEYVGSRKESNGTQVGKYTVWNSVVNYEINSNLSTYLKIDNLFDKYYQTANNYATSPRAFYVGLKYSF